MRESHTFYIKIHSFCVVVYYMCFTHSYMVTLWYRIERGVTLQHLIETGVTLWYNVKSHYATQIQNNSLISWYKSLFLLTFS